MNYNNWDAISRRNEVIHLKRRELGIICEQERLRNALQLAKDMILSNGLDIPKTMTVINKALGE